MKMAKIVYMQTGGIDTPEGFYTPFMPTMSVRIVGNEAVIYPVVESVTGGATVVKKGNAERIKAGTFPSLKNVIGSDAEESREYTKVFQGDGHAVF
jgi:hypothetical protein